MKDNYLKRELRLTEDQKQRIAERLANKQIPRPCPMCGHDKWDLVQYIGLIPVSHPDRVEAHETASLPAVFMQCKQCDFLATFFAAGWGLFPEEPEQPTHFVH